MYNRDYFTPKGATRGALVVFTNIAPLTGLFNPLFALKFISSWASGLVN